MNYLSDKEFIQSQKEKLLQNLSRLEEEIQKVTTKKKDGNYKTIFPDFGTEEDDNIQEVQVYEGNVSIENNISEIIKRIKKALDKIENNKYGYCETCNEPISKDRLIAFPEAENCSKHAK